MRMTALLCLLLSAALGWGLWQWTLGFEVWTFEGRRQVQLQAGALRAPQVALTGIDGRPVVLWRAADTGMVPAPVPAMATDSTPVAYLVDFIYTRCVSICLSLGSEYQQMQRALEASADGGTRGTGVHLVSISFDLEHDDPARLARYATQLRADPQRWTLAVPSSADAARSLLGALGVVVVPDGGGDYVHNGAIHLLDRQGRLRGLFAFDEWELALAAAQRLVATAGGGGP